MQKVVFSGLSILLAFFFLLSQPGNAFAQTSATGKIIFVDAAAYRTLSDESRKRDLYDPIRGLANTTHAYVIVAKNGRVLDASFDENEYPENQTEAIVAFLKEDAVQSRARVVSLVDLSEKIQRTVADWKRFFPEGAEVPVIIFGNDWAVRGHKRYRVRDRIWPDRCIARELRKSVPEHPRLRVFFRPSSAGRLPSENAYRALMRSIASDDGFKNTTFGGVILPGCIIPENAGVLPGSEGSAQSCEVDRLQPEKTWQRVRVCAPSQQAVAPGGMLMPALAVVTTQSTLRGDARMRVTNASGLQFKWRIGTVERDGSAAIRRDALRRGRADVEISILDDRSCARGGNVSFVLEEINGAGAVVPLKQVQITRQCGVSGVERTVSLGEVEVRR